MKSMTGVRYKIQTWDSEGRPGNRLLGERPCWNEAVESCKRFVRDEIDGPHRPYSFNIQLDAQCEEIIPNEQHDASDRSQDPEEPAQGTRKQGEPEVRNEKQDSSQEGSAHEAASPVGQIDPGAQLNELMGALMTIELLTRSKSPAASPLKINRLARQGLSTNGWLPLSINPAKTGRYIVGHKGYAKIMYYVANDEDWHPGTKRGWQGDVESWNPTHYRPLEDLP